jgi:hypothetical protein
MTELGWMTELGPETALKNLIATRVPACRAVWRGRVSRPCGAAVWRGRVARTFLSANLVRLNAGTLLIRMAEIECQRDAVFAGGRLEVGSDHGNEAGVFVGEMAHVRVINVAANEPTHGSASHNV